MTVFSRLFLILLSCCVLAGIPDMAQAQLLPAPAKQADKADAAPVTPADSLGRDTPRGTVAGFLAAVAEDDMKKASDYLDMSHLSSSRRKTQGPDLAEGLQMLLDKEGWVSPTGMLSGEKAGKENDDQPNDIDKVGTIRNDGKSIDVLVQRVPNEDGTEIWLFATQTVARIPTLREGLREPPVNKILPQKFIDDKFYGAPIGHWLAVLVLFAASYSATWILIHGLAALIRRTRFKKDDQAKAHFIDAFIIPLSLYLAVWVFSLSALFLGISIIVRHYFSQLNIIIAWISLALLLWRLIDVFAETAQKKITKHGRFMGFSSIIFFIRRITKFLFVVLTTILVLDSLGVNVTAGLAALGIGGIALALGAQKTLEHFIGSVAIVIDQPIHIGDYCRIGTDTFGTIEDIGMRSTRVRTNDRTVITIPNGNMSSMVIENYARRERILLSTKLRIRYDATPEQIHDLVGRINAVLAKTPKIISDPMAARFTGFIPEALIIEIFVYFGTADYNEFLRLQQDVMLKIMQAIADSGCYFAVPSQTFLPPPVQV